MQNSVCSQTYKKVYVRPRCVAVYVLTYILSICDKEISMMVAHDKAVYQYASGTTYKGPAVKCHDLMSGNLMTFIEL